jgi:hypothetical protein
MKHFNALGFFKEHYVYSPEVAVNIIQILTTRDTRKQDQNQKSFG